jgi:8-oxo-dGTP diphosphatase
MTKVSGLAPDHLRFAVLATDTTLFTIRDGRLLVRLIKVERLPSYPSNAGLPGGLLCTEETAPQATTRHLIERAKINASGVYCEQLFTFSALERDPRGRVVAVAYLALVPWEKLSEEERQDTTEAWWSPIKEAKNLAYDHDEMLASAISRLRSRVSYTTLISKLIPETFTLTELEQAYASVIKTHLDKRNFRKKVEKLGILSLVPNKKRKGAFRPAKLYRFTSKKVTDIPVL